MSEPKPFCWSFPDGRAILFPFIVTIVAFVLSIVVNLSCEYVTITVDTNNLQPLSNGDFSGRNIFGESSGFRRTLLSKLSTLNHEPTSEFEYAPSFFPPSSDPFMNEAGVPYQERILQSSEEEDFNFNGGLWKMSRHDSSDLCFPFLQNDEPGILDGLEIDAALKSARAGGVLASISSFAVAVVFCLNTCIHHSVKTQVVLFFLLLMSFLFQGMTALVFISDLCKGVKIDPTSELIPMECKPSWALYCASVSSVFFLVAAIAQAVVPRKKATKQRHQQQTQLPRAVDVHQAHPSQRLRSHSGASNNHDHSHSSAAAYSSTAAPQHGQKEAAIPQGPVTKRTFTDGSTEVTSRYISPEGDVVMKKETTYPDGTRRTERFFELKSEGGAHSIGGSGHRQPSQGGRGDRVLSASQQEWGSHNSYIADEDDPSSMPSMAPFSIDGYDPYEFDRV